MRMDVALPAAQLHTLSSYDAYIYGFISITFWKRDQKMSVSDIDDYLIV